MLAYFVEGDRLKLHAHAGYTVALLVLFRCVWGITGSKYGRFSEFVVRPSVSLRYLSDLLKGNSKMHLGHNPAGALMIVILLCCIFFTAITGISLYALEGSGPLANTFIASWPGGVLESVHELLATLSIALIIIHVFGVMLSSYLDKENLTISMFTGYKRKHHGEQP